MLDIFEVTAPFFALILCGYLASRLRLLPAAAVPALNAFVLYFALPCMLFRFSARTPFGDLVNLPVFLAYMTAGLAMLGAFALFARRGRGDSARDAIYGGLAAAWSNWGYMGFALLPAILGPAVLPIVVAAGMADLLAVVSATLALDALAQRAGGAAAAAAGALRRVARNPLIWSIVAGGAFSAAGLELPRVPGQLARLLGEAAVPVALFTIGASLFQPGIRWEWGGVLWIAGAKLLAHPLLAALVAAQLFRLSALEVTTLTLSASLPVAGTVYLFAERAGANGERIAAAILVSTALAFLTFSSLSWLLAPGAAR
ncbi:MAG: AEC family transporter [Burkholderiales bacterium]|nr:AEC family transporter [Burkholderiales bacterium]